MLEFLFDTYGFYSNNLDEIASKVGLALGVQLEARYSSYMGDYYLFRAQRKDDQVYREEIRLRCNYWEGEENWAEPNFKEYPLILEIMGTQRSAELEHLLMTILLGNVFLLHRETDEA